MHEYKGVIIMLAAVKQMLSLSCQQSITITIAITVMIIAKGSQVIPKERKKIKNKIEATIATTNNGTNEKEKKNN